LARFTEEIVMTDKLLLYQFDNVQVDLQTFRVSKDGEPVSLEPKAFEVLVFFIRHQGRLVEKSELLDAVWHDSFVTPNALTRVIAQLRKSLGDDAKEARYIETVPTRGYRFIAAVKAVEVVKDKSEATGQEPAQAHPEMPLEQAFLAGRAARHRHSWKMPGVAGLLLLLASFIFFFKPGPDSDGNWISVRRTTQITAAPLIDMYPAFSPDGETLAYCTVREGSFEIFVRPLTPGSKELQVTTDGGQNMQPTWSPDGKMIAFHSRQRGGIWVIPALGGIARQLTEFGADPAWSPDGQWISFQSEAPVDINQAAFPALPPSTLWLVPAQGGTAKQITRKANPLGGHGAPAWSPDGKRIVFVSYLLGRSEVWTITPAGNELQQFTSGFKHYYDPVFSLDGNFIYLTTSAGNFQMWRKRILPATGQPLGEAEEIANTGAALARYLTIAPDGKRLAYSLLMMANNLGSVQLSPHTGAALGAPILLTQDTNRRKTAPSFSLDGKSIVYSLWRAGAGGELWLMDADGSNPRQLTAGLAGLPNWLPDGKRIAVVAKESNTQQMWAIDVETGKQSVLSAQTFPLAMGKLSPDGQLFAYNSNTNGVINVSTLPVAGGPAKQLTFDQELIGFPCWSRDGQWLAVEVKRGADTQIAVIPREGGAPEPITSEAGQNWPGGWAADHDRIAFAGQRNGLWNVYWVSRRTKEFVQLTNYTKPNTYVRYPVWSPLSNQIVYEFGETTGNIWMLELK
jgi:Tol biopolymer transport system component/DNA-binding winged helix-turn-helix (wHTH) protein